jgi:outer membrane lipoprotein-sorting protein
MKRINLAAAAIAGATLAASGAASAPHSIDPMVVAAMSAPSTVSYTGVVETVRIGSRTSEASVYRIEHRAPGLTRRVYLSPSTLSGDWTVTNGSENFSVNPKRQQVLETPNDAADSAATNANYALLRQNYHVVRKGGDTVAGRRTIDLALVSNSSGRTTMLMRVDPVSKFVLEQKEFAPDGAPLSEMRFEEIRYSSPVPAADFALPKTYAVIRSTTYGTAEQAPDRVVAGAGFAAQEPRALPGGFSPVDGNIVTLHGVRTVHLLYSDGLRSVSLFESADPSTLESTRAPRSLRVGGRDAQYAEDGAMALLAWGDGRLHYTLVSVAGLVDLQQLAAALNP